MAATSRSGPLEAVGYAVFDKDGKPQSVTSFVAARVERIELDASGSTLVLSNGERATSGNVRAILNG